MAGGVAARRGPAAARLAIPLPAPDAAMRPSGQPVAAVCVTRAPALTGRR